jgi:predicted nucleic acid-binding protein
VIVLDTNVLSEVMRARPSQSVVAWLNAQDSESLYVSAITIGELTYGLRTLPLGNRRSRLESQFDRLIALGFEQRVLAYDDVAARICGELLADRKALGRPLGLADAQIAAIARREHFAVATRNGSDFQECGLDIVDPFDNGS